MAHTTHAERRWRALEPHRETAIAVVRPLVDGYFDPEDCVHDAMLRVAQWDALDLNKARGLLCHAARQVAIDRFRTRSVAQRAFVRLSGFERTRESVSPEQVAIRREELRRALATLATILTERERDVTLLRLRGLSPGETADRLGLTLKTVESAYNRARERFARQARDVGYPAGASLLAGSAVASIPCPDRRATGEASPAGARTIAAGSAPFAQVRGLRQI